MRQKRNINHSKRKQGHFVMLILLIIFITFGYLVLKPSLLKPSPYKQKITIGDFKCYGYTEEEKRTCKELAQYVIIRDTLEGYSLEEIFDEIEKRSNPI